ncbi:MAG: protein kinase [Planctomycetota bacterium]
MDDSERHELARELSEELYDLPPEEREQVLAERGLDDEVLGLVRRLLDYEPKLAAFDEEQTGGVRLGLLDLARPASPPPDEALPSTIAGYAIEGILGRGGMGIVYRAVQEQPRREVAIKVLPNLTVSPGLLRRFEYEAEILARLDHPFIANVIQSGLDEASGTPFLVMEYVHGVDVQSYCREQALALNELLGLFCNICDGIEHAHQRGVIHRDLKPANVLVTAEGAPRILDFGIARPVEGQEVSTPGKTIAGSVLGTLGWMSPEQARGELERLDVRCDVYALGVLLFHLLSDSMPHDVASVPTWEAARRISEDPPARLRDVRPELPADLDAITAKALEKELDRRYPSAGALRRDIERHLRFEPVEARPPSTTYHIVRFARRHRLLVTVVGAASAAVVVALITVVLFWQQALRAEREARLEAKTSENVTRFLSDMLEDPADYRGGDPSTTVREVLELAAPTLVQDLADEPEVSARLLQTISGAYNTLGLWDESLHYNTMARRIVEGLPDSEQRLFDVLHSLATTHLGRNEWAEASGLLDELERIDTSSFERPEKAAVELLMLRGSLKNQVGDGEASIGAYREAVALARRSAVPDWLLESCLIGLSDALIRTGYFDEAEGHLLEILDRRGEQLGAGHPKTLVAQSKLVLLYQVSRDLDRAREIALETARLAEESFGSEHPFPLTMRLNLAKIDREAGRAGAAREQLEQVVVDIESALGPRDHLAILANLHLGNALSDLRRWQDVIERLGPAAPNALEVLGPGHKHCLMLAQVRAMAHAELGELDRCDEIMAEHRDLVRENTDPDNDLRWEAEFQLANVLHMTARPLETLDAIDESLELASDLDAMEEPAVLRLQGLLARTLVDLDMTQDASGVIDETVAAMRERFGAEHPVTVDHVELQVVVHIADGNGEEARAAAARLLELTPTDAPRRAALERLAARAQSVP